MEKLPGNETIAVNVRYYPCIYGIS